MSEELASPVRPPARGVLPLPGRFLSNPGELGDRVLLAAPSSLSETLLAGPAFRALRAGLVRAELTLLGRRASELAELLPFFDHWWQPTCNRLTSLVYTLAGVAGQSLTDLRAVVADQSDDPVRDDSVVQSLCRVIEARGGAVEWHRRLVQNLLLRRWGGCALLPSGTYHSELPSTVLNCEGTVDGKALDLLPEMVARYGEGTGG